MVRSSVWLAQAVPVLDESRGSALASWTPLSVMASVFVVLVVVLAYQGRGAGRQLLGIPVVVERWTGVPGWAGSTLLLSMYGLLVAGYGFYTDVAWHVALGRDDELFTAPHTAIFVGLWLIALGPVAGWRVAMADPRRSWSGQARWPRSLLPLSVLGVAALLGFPIDELWHSAYGIDVTMWSPPHLIMILAASFSGLASWLVLADAGVRPSDGRWGRSLHVAAAVLSLQGLSSVQGEFSFGVPQWQQLYHPVLFCLAAGLVLVLIRIVHGRGWAIGIAGGLFVFHITDIVGSGPVDTRSGATYLGAALAVETVAILLGTRRRLRFAVVSGGGIATLGLAVEWLWNQDAHQSWTAALFPDALLLALPAAVSAAVIGASLAGAIARPPARGARLPAAVVAIALVTVIVSLAVPAPRRSGEVAATVTLHWVDEDRAVVEAVLDPPEAAQGARWFTVGSWQWGGRTILHMQQTAPGHYTSDAPIYLAGRAKSLLRLHRGAEMMAIPIRLPADPVYHLPAVPPQDRTASFQPEQQYLQREADVPNGGLTTLVHTLIVLLAGAWIASMTYTVAHLSREHVPAPLTSAPAAGRD